MDKVTTSSIERMDPKQACEGCSKAYDWAEDGSCKCLCYAEPEQTYGIRVFGQCNMNFKQETKHRGKVRAGQQKTKRNRGR
ncbi:MAG: hypothetical protein ACYS32_00480 [Planctomycetota bacterium]|jgi:hypothetical protein